MTKQKIIKVLGNINACSYAATVCAVDKNNRNK